MYCKKCGALNTTKDKVCAVCDHILIKEEKQINQKEKMSEFNIWRVVSVVLMILGVVFLVIALGWIIIFFVTSLIAYPLQGLSDGDVKHNFLSFFLDNVGMFPIILVGLSIISFIINTVLTGNKKQFENNKKTQ